MKNKILFITLLLLTGLTGLAQDNTRVFSFTPISKNNVEVNGMAIGLGNLWNREHEVKINGLNLELNPLTPLIILFLDPEKVPNDKALQKYNGLHLSTAGFMGQVAHNGVAISAYHVTYETNGLSITCLYNVSKTLNGLHISGIANSTEKGAGILISAANYGETFTGLQLGIYNHSENFTGIQIGLFNRTKKLSGLQLGLWNINEKRSLPIINW